MPGPGKHSEKWHRCWEEVQAKGHDESSAAAICTAQLGEESFATAEAQEAYRLAAAGKTVPVRSTPESRHLHLRLATAGVKTGLLDGREHLVVPVVALVEGVIHAVNADTPEFVSASRIASAAHTFNGRPLMLGHPTKDGRQISANDPDVQNKQAFGRIYKSAASGNKLGMEAWIDPQKLEALGQQKLLAQIREGKTSIPVSVGAFVTTLSRGGEYKGKKYAAEWATIQGDHLAFLPNGRGACSLDMGCGTHRAAEAAPEEYEIVGDEIRTLEQEKTPSTFLTRAAEFFKALYTVAPDDLVARGAAPAVTKEDCPTCQGTGSVDGNPCETCDGTGEILKAAEAVKIKETTTMTVQEKAAMIRTLADCNCGFTQKTLDTMEESELKAIAASAEAWKKTQTDLETTKTKLVEVETALRAAQEKPKTMTEEEFMAAAPVHLRTMVERSKAAETERKTELVTALKTAQSAYSEEELKALELSALEKLAKVAQVGAKPVNYGGRGVPRAADDKDVFRNPPDPYEPHLKVLRERMKVS